MWTTGPFKKGKEYFFVFRKHFLSYSLRRPDKERVKKRVGHPSYLHSTVRTDVLMGPKWTKSIRCGHGIPSGMAQRLQFFCPFRILYGFSHYSFSVLKNFVWFLSLWSLASTCTSFYAWMIEPFPFFCANEKNIFNFPRTRSPRNSYPWWLLFTSFDYLIVFTFIFNKKKVHIFSLRKISAF